MNTQLFKRAAGLCAAFAITLSPTILRGQMKIVVEHREESARIVSFRNHVLDAIRSDGTIFSVREGSIQVLPDTAFDEGFVDVEYVRDDLKRSRNVKKIQRIRPSFHIDAIVTSDRDLANCILLYAFPSNGQIDTHLVSVGKLKAGQPKRVPINIFHTPLDSEGRSRVFSNGFEVRSSESATPGQTLADQVLEGQDSELHPSFPTFDRETYKLSPDGRYAKKIERFGDQNRLTLIDLDNLEPIRSEIYDSGDFRNFNFAWADADNYIVLERAKIIVVDRDSGEKTLLTENVQSLMGGPSPSSPDEILILQRGFIKTRRNHKASTIHSSLAGGRFYRMLNWKTGETRNLFYSFPEDSIRIFYDSSASPCIAETRTNDGPRYYRRSGNDEWRAISEINTVADLLFDRPKSSEHLKQSTTFISISDNPDLAYLISNYRSEMKELFLYDLKNGTMVKPIARNNFYDIEGIERGSNPLILHPTDRSLLGLAYQSDLPRLLISDRRLAEAQALAGQVFPPPYLSIMESCSTDLQRVLFRCRAPSRFDQFVLVDRGAKTIKVLGNSTADSPVPERTLRRFTTHDGYAIDAYLTIPQNQRSGTLLPLVALPQDDFSIRASWLDDPAATYFANQGYLALRVNVRGTVGYGKAHYRAGLEGELDGPFIDDLADAVRSLIVSQEADPDRIYIFGSVMGGLATYLSLIDHPDLYKAGASAYGYEDLLYHFDDSQYKRYLQRYSHISSFDSLAHHVNALASDKHYANRVSPLQRSDEIKAPLLIIQDNSNRRHEKKRHADLIERSLNRNQIVCKRIEFAHRVSAHSLNNDEQHLLLTKVFEFFESFQSEP